MYCRYWLLSYTWHMYMNRLRECVKGVIFGMVASAAFLLWFSKDGGCSRQNEMCGRMLVEKSMRFE